MKLDVLFSPLGLTPAEVQGRTVFVVDILRLSTTVCAALHHGARAVIPVPSTEEALRMAQTLGPGEVVLAGERNGLPIPGFALGNSPGEMTPEAVKGRLVIITTTNGTGALLAVQGAAQVYCAAAANFSLAAAAAREIWARDRDMVILCAGRDHRFSLDDAYCAGRLASVALGGVRRRQGLNDAGLAALHLVRRYGERWERPLLSSRAGRELSTIGLKHDVLDCARADAYPVLALFHERRVTAAST